MQDLPAFASDSMPETHRLVGATTCKQMTRGAKPEMLNAGTMTIEALGLDQLTIAHLPKANDAVTAPAGYSLPTRMEDDTLD
jgi:hypothetical protein